jgi:hypothetical protein
MTGPGAKSTMIVKESIANMSAQIEKLDAASARIQANQETLQGDQSHLTVAVNHLQSKRIEDGNTSAMAPCHGKATTADNTDTITHATKHRHKLLFPTYDDTKDPLSWLNQCDQFFRIQETPEADKVFLTSFYMSGEASQWFTLLERNQGKP